EGPRAGEPAEALDRAVEVIQGPLDDAGHDLRPGAIRLDCLMHDQAAPRPRHALGDHPEIKWSEGAEIDDLGIRAGAIDMLERAHRLRHHPPPGHDRELFALSHHPRAAGRESLAIPVIGASGVEAAVLHEADRAVVAD